MKGLALTVVAVALVLLFTEGAVAKGPCCHPKPGWSNGQVTLNCNDCKAGTPYCGKGRCNLWGCNCDDGCREGTCGGFFSAPEVHKMVDSNKDGRISHAEALDYLTTKGIKTEHLPPIFQSPTPDAAPSHYEFLPDDIITADDHKYDICIGHEGAPQN